MALIAMIVIKWCNVQMKKLFNFIEEYDNESIKVTVYWVDAKQ